MSRIARVPISLGNVKCQIHGQDVELTSGSKKAQYKVHTAIEVSCDEHGIHCVLRPNNMKEKAQLGTAHRNLMNAVIGLTKGFSETLILKGVGYKVAQQGQNLTLHLGYSQPVEFPVETDLTVECPDKTTIVISGISKQKVGQVCANIIKLRKPDSYHSKGVQMKGREYKQKEVKKS